MISLELLVEKEHAIRLLTGLDVCHQQLDQIVLLLQQIVNLLHGHLLVHLWLWHHWLLWLIELNDALFGLCLLDGFALLVDGWRHSVLEVAHFSLMSHFVICRHLFILEFLLTRHRMPRLRHYLHDFALVLSLVFLSDSRPVFLHKAQVSVHVFLRLILSTLPIMLSLALSHPNLDYFLLWRHCSYGLRLLQLQVQTLFLRQVVPFLSYHRGYLIAVRYKIRVFADYLIVLRRAKHVVVFVDPFLRGFIFRTFIILWLVQ